MPIEGAAGFPMVNGIPRGEAFVSFIRSTRGESVSGTVRSSAGSSTGPTPGGFDDNAARRTVSENRTKLDDGTIRNALTREYDDGSRRTETRDKMPDGSVVMSAERRSLPDAEGFERVRVWTKTIAPDGTARLDMRVFRVPAGMTPDWDAAGTQQYLLDSSIERTAADGTVLPDMPALVLAAETEGAESKTTEDTVTPSTAQPIIPLRT